MLLLVGYLFLNYLLIDSSIGIEASVDTICHYLQLLFESQSALRVSFNLYLVFMLLLLGNYRPDIVSIGRGNYFKPCWNDLR